MMFPILHLLSRIEEEREKETDNFINSIKVITNIIDNNIETFEKAHKENNIETMNLSISILYKSLDIINTISVEQLNDIPFLILSNLYNKFVNAEGCINVYNKVTENNIKKTLDCKRIAAETKIKKDKKTKVNDIDYSKFSREELIQLLKDKTV